MRLLMQIVGPILFVTLIGGEDQRRQTVVLDHCPNGGVRHDDSCYIASHELANWPDSMVYCKAYAGHLAYINNAREQQFLTGYLRNINAATTDPDHYFWIGGTDALSEGDWFWAGTLQHVQYTNWKAGEPNNNPNHQSHHQDCMAIYSQTGLWDDGWCETNHNFLCEIELNTETSIVG